MKIGILGGTFNPVHSGHLINAQTILEELSLDSVFFIPSKYPVHKELEGDISAMDRLAMVKLAIQGNERFEALSLELDREEPSYTIYTIEELMKRYPGAELFLIMGADSFNEFHTWREYQRIAGIVTIVVMRRPGDSSLRRDLLKECPSVVEAGNPLIDISSSAVRARIKEGRRADYMVPAQVIQYIKNKGLYTK